MGLTSAVIHRKNINQKEFSSVYWLNLFISVLLFVLLFFSTPLISNFYNEEELNKIIPILGLNLLLVAFGSQHRTMMQKEFKFKTISIIEIFSFFSGLVSAGIFVFLDYGIYSLVYSTLLNSFIQNILFFFLNSKQNPVLLYFKFNSIKDLLRIGSYQFGSTLLVFFSKELDILIIGKFLGSEVLGVYSLSKQLVIKTSGIINPTVTKVLSPVFASLQEDNKKLKESYLKMIYYLASINIPIYFLLIILSKEILGLLYGPEYMFAPFSYLVLRFCGIAYCTKSISNPIGSLFIAKGRTDLGFKWSIIQILISSIFITFASFFNINMVAATTAFLAVILLVPQWKFAISPCLDIKLKEYVQQFGRLYFLLIGLSAIFLLIENFVSININLFLSAFIKAAVLLFVFLITVMLVDKERLVTLKKLQF